MIQIHEQNFDGEYTEHSKFGDETSTFVSRLTYHWLEHVFTFYKDREVNDIIGELGPVPLKFQTSHMKRKWTQTWMAEVVGRLILDVEAICRFFNI